MNDLAKMLARVMTLPKASRAHGKPPQYYQLRRLKYRDHEDGDLRFPQPVRESDGAEEFDIVELALWDARRLEACKATPQGKARTKEQNDDSE